jgi:hypothetical protein
VNIEPNCQNLRPALPECGRFQLQTAVFPDPFSRPELCFSFTRRHFLQEYVNRNSGTSRARLPIIIAGSTLIRSGIFIKSV